ncbi:HAMP domain-containing histidine kinase [Arthrobacter sp. FW305-BF8]|uniref:sensor histidine kinase n=1 Tax=Arthrobacter sp. FW305-BF8 TaxID=2879617 RepID=UPI001F4440D4|nr:HAMP domain-containing sensor histidine kinase [Arthrobacter sp. FW305-BF8]UKA53173.1 HAMP domain-containing histidine kinase [Arthrobacter sp. FW305-BF8]
MGEHVLVRDTDRFFRRLRPRVQVALCQLPVTVILAALAIAAPAVWPTLIESPVFIAAIVMMVTTFLACFLVPWERLPPNAYLVIPILDMVVIGLARNGAVPAVAGLGVLAIFPVIWLSSSDNFPRTTIFLSFFGTLLIGIPTLVQKFPKISPSDIATAILLPLMMLAVSLAIRFATANVRLQRQRLEKKDAELRELLVESRNRERLLKTILDTTDVGIVAVDADGQKVLVNNQQQTFRQAAAPAGTEQPLEAQQLMFGQDRVTPLPLDKRPISRAVAGETFADYLVWLGEGPSQRAVATAARIIKNDDGGFSGAVVVYSDVTGLVEALSAKEELISNVSHEFRSPLMSVLGNVDLVLDEADALSPDSVRRLEVVQRNAERLLSLVSELLVSASAVLAVHPRRTDLAGLIENSIGSVQAQADASNVSLSTDVPAPLWAHADPLRISQALDNLVSNAVKYSPDGGKVTVSARRSESWVQLKVQDTGMGISEEETSRIFTRFFRTQAARQAAIPGVGLGLSITKTIVERHGGDISCQSKPGAGTTFTLTLPAEGTPES